LPPPAHTGRPRADDRRRTFEGILYILITVWRRLKRWGEEGIWERIWRAALAALDRQDQLDWSLAFLGGSSSCPFVPGVNTSGVYVTTNGGATWSQQILHWNSSGLVSDGDPVVAFGPKPDGNGGFSYANGARAYFGSLAGSPTFGPDQELVAVSYSDDGGLTWSAPVVATNRDNKVAFNDKIALWADANPASPNFGNVYVS
jgi:hypothetical protein